MKRMKGPDYKDKVVFGVPLIVHVQRYGHPLPLSLQLALRYLRSQCLDQVPDFIHICKIDYTVQSNLGHSQKLHSDCQSKSDLCAFKIEIRIRFSNCERPKIT